MLKDDILGMIAKLPASDEKKKQLSERVEANPNSAEVLGEILTETGDMLDQEEIDILKADPASKAEIESAVAEASSELDAAEEELNKEMGEINKEAEAIATTAGKELDSIRMNEIKEESK